MKAVIFIYSFCALITIGSIPNWSKLNKNGYAVFYHSTDSGTLDQYVSYLENGRMQVASFFDSGFQSEYEVYIHPDRESLDSTWQKDWGMSSFQSQCWMVASGVSHKLDLLSPGTWKDQSCEHNPDDTTSTKKLITHELVHVFHGQLNASPDFSEVSGIDWFVEGLATYASGQLDKKRLDEVIEAVEKGATPEKLAEFWTGQLRYGLSGSMVSYIDYTYGRAKLTRCLPFNNLEQVLSFLDVTEEELIAHWKKFVVTLK